MSSKTSPDPHQIRSKRSLDLPHQRSEIREEQNPPIPPQAVALAHDSVPIEVRRLRVANGSRRKRDLAAVKMADELQRLESIGQADAEVARCWSEAKARVEASLPSPTFNLWIAPIELVGATATALVLSAPEGIRAWTERRYSRFIREALAGMAAPYADVEFVKEGEPCR